MPVSIDVQPDIARKLSEFAAGHGLTIDESLETLLEAVKPAQPNTEGSLYSTPQERAKIWREWVERNKTTVPNLVDDSREGIYRDREDSQI